MQFIKKPFKFLKKSLYWLGFTAQYFVTFYRKNLRRMKVLTLSEPNEHVFFGYYDMSPFNNDDTKVLAVKTNHPLKTPAISSCIKIGYFEVGHNIARRSAFIEVGESKAWCWQQGCRLQWYPKNEAKNLIFYNTLENDKYIGVIQNIITKKIIKKTPIPLYEISNCGQKGLSLNFSRLQRLRPGYGYNALPDETAAENIPSNDGVFFYDFKTDKYDLVISYKDIVQIGYLPEGWQNCQHYINHLSFNPSGSKFIFLHLLVTKNKRFSRLLVSNTDGSELKVLNDSGKVSHYTWKDDFNLLNFCKPSTNEKKCYALYNLEDASVKKIGYNTLKSDGHPTFFQDRNLLLTDTYPNSFRYQNLIIYNLSQRKFALKEAFFRNRKFLKEWRTDLHPRLSCDEKTICIDDEKNGHKAIKLIRIENDR